MKLINATQYNKIRKTTIYLIVAGLLAVAVGLSVRALSKTSTASAATVSGKVCGNTSTGNAVNTVIVISEENRTWSGVGGVGFLDPAMPYTNSVASQCGVFANDTEVDTSQNSATQYIGAWTGYGITSNSFGSNTVANDCSPSTSCQSTFDNIFRRFRQNGIPHAEYVEGATSTCSASGNAAKHIPDLYMFGTYSDATGTHNDHDFCNSEVLPISSFNWTAPPAGYSFITPTLCNDGHDCGNSTVDSWLSTRLQSVFDSAAYKAGKVVVQLWYDEDHPKPNLFACWSCSQFSNSTIDPHYSGESQLWLNELGAPISSLGAISTATDIRSTLFSATPPPTDNPPAVNITAPTSGATLTTSPVTVSANATDDIGVTKVEFYDGTTLLNTDTTSPYTFSWNTSSLSGSQTLTAKAYDTGGHVTVSSPVTVTINNTTTCQNNPTNTLGTGTTTISVPSQGTYHVWSRIMAPDTTNNSYYIQVDTGCPIVVGDSTAIPANTWTWLDYQDGTTTSHTTVSLTAGNHTITMIGRESGVSLDRVLFLSDTCVPTDTGENCADTTAPTVSVTSPTAGQTVSGASVPLAATATDNTGGSGIAKVDFQVDGVTIGTSTTSPYQLNWNSTAVADGTHNIQAKATDIAGNSTTSSSVSVTVQNKDITPPTAPTNLAVTKNVYNEVDLSWTKSTDNVGVTGYRVMRNGVTISTVTTTTFNDTSVSPNTAYTYSVAAVDAAGNVGQASNTVSVTTPNAPDQSPPSAPSNLAASNITASNVSLSWTASIDNVGVTGYQVIRNNVVIATVTQTSYSDTTVLPSTNYSYGIVAFDAAGNPSGLSNVVTVTTPAAGDTLKPSAPTNLAGNAVSATQINLTWTASTDNFGVAGYNVFRNGTKIGTTTNTTFGDATVIGNTTYNYYVVAFDAAGNNSDPSNQISVTTPAPPPPTITTITLSPTDDSGLHKSHPDTNYGLGSTMTVDASPIENFIMKFTVTGVGSQTVTSAQLQLWNIDSSNIGGIFHAVSNNNWDENTVTWNNAPAASSGTLFSLGSVSKNHYYLVDLSNYITADGTYSIRVDTTSSGSAAYSTHNAPTLSHRPVLILTVQQ